ncbi:MAG: CPBP family intramembrane metalloprotease, partial [Prevotella sp.]|nr:CPBP family intramembrane metalloprotease [Prevotella sp.]
GIASLFSNIIAVVLFVKMRWASLNLNAIPRRHLLSVLLGGAGLAFAQAVPVGWLAEILNVPDWLTDIFNMSMNDFWGIIAICIGAPVAEELIFRGAIQRTLHKKVGPIAAIVIAAAIFGVIHMNPVQVFGAFLMGLVLGWLYYRTGSVWPGIVFHAVNNTLSTILGQIFGVDAKLIDMTGSNTATTIALIVSIAGFILLFTQLNGLFKFYRPTFWLEKEEKTDDIALQATQE